MVDAYGWNIHNRDSVTLCGPPQPAGSDPDVLSLGWHFDYEEESSAGAPWTARCRCWTSRSAGTSPTTPSRATAPFWMVPGSYQWSRQQRATWGGVRGVAGPRRDRRRARAGRQRDALAADPPAQRVAQSVGDRAQGDLRELHAALRGPPERPPGAGCRADRPQLTGTPAAPGGDGRPEPSARQRSGQQSQLPSTGSPTTGTPCR